MDKKPILIRMDPVVIERLDEIADKAREVGRNDSRASLIREAVAWFLALQVKDSWPTMPFMRPEPERLPEAQT